MSSPTGPASGLPVRMPRPRQPGRHRRPEPLAAPEGAPALVLAVPGTPSAATRSLAEEVVSIARSELPGLDARIGYLDGDDAEFPTLQSVLTHAAEERTARFEQARAAGLDVKRARRPRRRRRAAARRSGQRAAAPGPPGRHGQPCRGRADRCARPAPAARRGAARAAVRGRPGPRRPRPAVHRGDRRGRHHPGLRGRRGGRAGGRDHRHAARRAARRAGDGGGPRPGGLDRGHRRAAARLGLAAARARAVPDRPGDRRRSARGRGQGGGLLPPPRRSARTRRSASWRSAKYTTALGIAPQQPQGAPVR